ncbi:hypothetical protein RI065_00250 [Mycoplasmatota bacterium zrk1]
MESKNKLNEVPIANISEEEIVKIKELESHLGDKYYIVVLEK